MILVILCFFRVPLGETHSCQHDSEYLRDLRSKPPKQLIKKEKESKPTKLSIQDREQIRIQFYFGTLEKEGKAIDSEMCIGENNPSNLCTKDHVINDTVVDTLKKQFEYVKEFLEPLLKVNRVTEKLSTRDSGISSVKVTQEEKFDADLLIFVLYRPYKKGASTIASAVATGNRDSIKRPLYGYIKINPLMVPDAPQKFNDPNRNYFSTILHELNHVLCFANGHFNYWVNESGEPGNYIKTRYIEAANITQTFINSPRLTNWVNERFSITDPNLTNLGLEIEDGGGDGTAGSHPSARLYFTDLMQGTTYGPAYISPIFYLSLEDSGWYTLDEKYLQYQEDLVFLDPITTKEYYPQKTIIETGWKTFPQSKICSDTLYTHCFYDYRFKGLCSVNSSKLDYSTKQLVNWYNPFNKSQVGYDSLLDHVLLYLPTSLNCRSKESYDKVKKDPNMKSYEADHFAEIYGNNSVCAESSLYKATLGAMLPTYVGSCYDAWCGTDYRVRLRINNKEIFCKKDGQKASVAGYTGQVICPPGRVVCSSMPRKKMVNALEVFPDRGPIDGGNLVLINGNGFLEYKDKLTIKLGPASLDIIDIEDEKILCRVGKMRNQNEYVSKAVPLNITVNGNSELNTILEDMYTFVGITYNG